MMYMYLCGKSAISNLWHNKLSFLSLRLLIQSVYALLSDIQCVI